MQQCYRLPKVSDLEFWDLQLQLFRRSFPANETHQTTIMSSNEKSHLAGNHTAERSLGRRNAGHDRDAVNTIRNSFLTDNGGRLTDYPDEFAANDGKSNPLRNLKVLDKDELIAKANEFTKGSLPGGLSMDSSQTQKYFGANAKHRFFSQCNTLSKSRDILAADETDDSTTAAIYFSLNAARNFHNQTLNCDSTEAEDYFDPNRSIPLHPSRAVDAKLACNVNTRVLIRDQSLHFEDGFNQIKLVTKPSYITSEDVKPATQKTKSSNNPVLSPSKQRSYHVSLSNILDSNGSDSAPSTPTSMAQSDSTVKLSMPPKKGNARPKVKVLPTLSPSSPTKTPSSKVLPESSTKQKLKRLPPLQAESVISNIEAMFQNVLNAHPQAQGVSDSDSSVRHIDTTDSPENNELDAPAPLQPSLSATNIRAHNGGMGINHALSFTSNTQPLASPHKSTNGILRMASLKKTVSSLSRHSSTKSINSDRSKRSKVMEGGSLSELAEMYKQFKDDTLIESNLQPSLDSAIQRQECKEQTETYDIHAASNRRGVDLNLVCIEHRDPNNRDLMAAADGTSKLFPCVPAKKVKDFYSPSLEIEPKDSYEYSEMDTDIEIEMWGQDSILSPTQMAKAAQNKDDTDAMQLSPRSLYIDKCLRMRLNPRASLLLRKQFTRELNLKHLGMGDEMAILFAEALVHVPYVTSVNICDNNLTDRGLSAIVHSIVHMHDVCRLDMSFNTIGSDAASALAHYLSSSTCGLSELILQKADVDDDECGNFVTALHQNKSLRLLDLSENKVGSNENLNTVMPDIVTGGEALAELLRSSDCPLTTLKLGWNLIRLGGAEDLCSSLSKNVSITDLDLSFNSLGSTAGIALGDALQDNRILKSLRIANNNLDSIACLTICAGILQNQNLEFVCFDGNPIAEQGAKALMLLPTIVGSRVEISARSCNISLQDGNNWFDSGMITRPYELDLSQPFHRAVAIILTYLVPSHQTYIVAKSEYLDTQNPSAGFVNLALQEAVIEDTRHLEPAHLKEIEGLHRIRDATRDVRKAVALFQEVDKDGSGELDEEEFGFLMETLGMNLEEGKVKEVMAEYDVDGGGIIEMHEFLLFLRNQQKDAAKRLRELTEFPILISGLQYNLPAPGSVASQLTSMQTPSVSNNASCISMTSSGVFGRGAGAAATKPSYEKYFPPRHGILRISIIDGFTQKESYRVISQGDRSNIMQIAKQSGDVLQMTSFGVQNYKIRFAEAYGFVQTMSKENANKISILVTILPHMASPADARQLVNKVLNSNKLEINRLKREIGQAYKVIMGQPDGYYTLDLTQSMDRFCLTRLLEISMTRAHLRSVRFGTLGYGRLGDTSQKGNWSCFRNELYNKKPVALSIAFASPLPKTGHVEFDFVSLQRVMPDNFILNDVRFTNLLVKSFLLRPGDRFKALSVLKKIKHMCYHTINGDGKTVYETPKDKALEIGQHLSNFYSNLAVRSEQLDRYKTKENVKVSWEYDPDIIQLNLTNISEIYSIPSIFAEDVPANASESSKSPAKQDNKLVKAINKVRLLSTMSKPTAEADNSKSSKEKEADAPTSAVPLATAAPVAADGVVEQPSPMPDPQAADGHEAEDLVHKLDRTKYFVNAPEESQEDLDEVIDLSSSSDSEDDVDAEYFVDTKAYLARLASTSKLDVETTANASTGGGAGGGAAPSSSNSAVSTPSTKSRPSLLSTMLSNTSGKRNNSTSGTPAAPPGAQYNPSLLRDPILADKSRVADSETPESNATIYQNANTLTKQAFYIKSLPPEKKPLSETYNRFLCLMASRNIPVYAKAVKLLEVLIDVFEYSFMYSRHLEMIMIIFEDLGKLKISDHYGTYRVELFVSLFSNVVDVHNIEIVLRRLNAFEVASVIGRIGILNLFNPMKPEGSYELDLSRRDDRMVVKMLAQLSVVEPGDNLPYLAFQWERTMDYMPGYELTELWLTEDGLPNKGLWVATYYSGEGRNKRNCKPVTKFRKALCQLVLVDEEDMIPERLKDDEVLPPIYGPSVIHSNPGIWLGYLAYNEAEYKAFKSKKSQQESASSKTRGRK